MQEPNPASLAFVRQIFAGETFRFGERNLEPAEALSPREDRRDLTTRSFSVRAESINEEARSVDAVIATEAPVTVWDWRRSEPVDEVLLMAGAQIPGQMPMLANHSRWSLDDVLGSIRGMRVEGANLSGSLFFARNDPEADKAWNKVSQKHLVDVSVGYRVDEATEIPAGKTAMVSGRQFTAGARALRVATKWTPKEGSLVPIGADQAAKIREDSSHPHNPPQTHNPPSQEILPVTPTAEQVRADAEAQTEPQTVTPPASPASEPVRAEAPALQSGAPTIDLTAERERVRQILDLAEADVPPQLARQAVNEAWTVERASREFLSAVRGRRQAPVGPAIHSHSRETDTNVRSLAAAMAMTYAGLDGERLISAPLTNGQTPINRCQRIGEQDLDAARRIGALSAVDVARMCAQIDSGRWIMDAEEAIRAAVSGGSLTYALTTSAYAKLMAGWEETVDTTVWCDVEDVANFLTQDDIAVAPNATLDRLPRGGTANDATISDTREQYKIARYAKKFSVDEQDFIDDRLGAILAMPFEMGQAARRLRPDLVYSLFHENATMADTGAVFNATAVTTAGGHANLTTAVLGATGLKAAIKAMGIQRLSGAVLNIRPRWLIVPFALKWTAQEILLSSAQAYTAAAAAATPSQYFTANVLAAENLALVVDDRVGAAGVTDPRTKTARTGLDTWWFLSAGGPRTVRVAYRRGTGRAPQLRSYTLDKGQWGVGWDINLDIGAVVSDYRGLHMSTGAG